MSRPVPDAALRLAAIVESSDDAIVSKDLHGIVTSWNTGAERLFGYTADEMIGRSILTLIPPDRHGEEHDVLERIRRGDRVEHFETVRMRKDGTPVDISLSVSPILDATGTVVAASKIARDITDRRRTERALHAAQRRLMALAAASATIAGSPGRDEIVSAAVALAQDVFSADAYAVWQVDDEGSWRIVHAVGVSPSFADRVVGPDTTPSYPDRIPFAEPLVCDDVATSDAVANMRNAYAREGIRSLVVFPLEIRGERRGTMVFYSRHARSYQDIDIQVGKAIANLVAASLTTAELYQEQRQVRIEADHARQRATFLADASSVLSSSLDYEATLKAVARLAVPTIADWCAVDVLDEHGHLARLAVAHVDPDKVELAQQLQARYPPDPSSSGSVHEVLRTGRPTFMSRIPHDRVMASARDEGHRRLLEALHLTSYMCLPLVAQGKPFGAITFVSAESGREYSEDDLQLGRDLAARASLAVDNARSYARATEANRLKDEFLATLSHELRTPLNAVLGYTSMLRRGLLAPDRAATALEAVERNATGLKQIIDDIMDVSRIVAGRLRLNVQPVELPRILQDCCATVMPAAEARGVRVETIIDPLTTPVSGDPDRLQQIVWNLLSNAIKFTARGGKVQLRLARVNSHVEITVSDTGRGIAPEFLPFIFERFRQGDASMSREHGGLGLGLAIARQLTELHGGTLSAASDGVGHGATFRVELPLMIVHGTPPHERREQPRTDRADNDVASRTQVPRLDGIRVVAVDDEPDALALLRLILEDAGADVWTARSAAQALELLQTIGPDVLLSDVGMPGGDGLQLIRTIREMDEPLRSTPAAALTAYARAQDRITSLASGFHMHLTKPIEPLELVVAVAALAARRRTR